MPQTALFNALEHRVSELGSRMLPVTKEDLTYTAAERDHVRAYVLLVHAEIEAFLEQRVQDEVTLRIDAWNVSRTPSVVLMGLLAFHKVVWVGTIDSLVPPSAGDTNPTWSDRDIDRRLKRCHTEAVSSLKSNNGVKAADVLQMLLRLGFRIADIDADLIGKLDGLGSLRGGFAHNSVRAVSTEPDPALVKKMVTEIIAKLKDLDEAIRNLPIVVGTLPRIGSPNITLVRRAMDTERRHVRLPVSVPAVGPAVLLPRRLEYLADAVRTLADQM